MLDNLELIGTGFAVVMMALALLWAALAIMARFFVKAPSTSAPAPAAQKPKPASASVSGVPPHHLAAIAAAVADTMGAGYRITRVAAPGHKVNEWPLEGRIATFSSHRMRTDWGPTRPTLGGETPNMLRGQKQ